jgi:hypothetical protein
MTTDACVMQIRAVRVNTVQPDPTLDVEGSDIGGYVSTRKLDKLVRLPECTDFDAIFVLDRLGPKTLSGALKYSNGIHAQDQTPEQRLLAFQYGCRKVERPGRDPIVSFMPGEGVQGSKFKARQTSYGYINSDAFLQEVCDEYSPEVVQEMGSIILTWSGLPKGQVGPFFFWGGLHR